MASFNATNTPKLERRNGLTMTSDKARKFGETWRFLAHREDASVELKNQGVFDELVVDKWLHIEQMEDDLWWIRVGDIRIWVRLGDEQPTVDVERGCYGPVKGATRTLG
jgi:hypothetical protein